MSLILCSFFGKNWWVSVSLSFAISIIKENQAIECLLIIMIYIARKWSSGYINYYLWIIKKKEKDTVLEGCFSVSSMLWNNNGNHRLAMMLIIKIIIPNNEFYTINYKNKTLVSTRPIWFLSFCVEGRNNL